MNKLYGSSANPSSMNPTDHSHNGIYLGHWKFNLERGKLSFCANARKILGPGLSKHADLREALATLTYSYRTTLIRAYKSAIFTGSNLNIELMILTPNGVTKWIHIIGTLSFRRWGAPDSFVGTIEDTTQRRVEEHLNLAVIGHEIRNPLSIIKLNTELVLKLIQPNQDQRQIRLLSMVDEHVNGITSVLDEYLSTSVNERRQTALQLCEFDLNNMLDKLVSEMQVLHRQHKFDRAYDGEIWVNADKNRIVRVLINYLTNAVKFSHPSSVIKISSVVREGYAEICVTDQGIGVPKGWEEKIFEKFYICPDKKGRQQNSKGLGLYLVKSIIHEHGGKVRAEQVKNGGTSFYFSLPVLHPEEKLNDRKLIA